MFALSKLDEFHLSRQFRTCFVAVLQTSSNNNSEVREPTGDRSLNDRGLEMVVYVSRSSNLSGSDLDGTHHNCMFFKLRKLEYVCCCGSSVVISKLRSKQSAKVDQRRLF